MSTLLEEASLVMIPSGYKEDIVYSQIPTDGSGDLTFTRASNGTRVNSAGLVEVCPWNAINYSEDFSNAAWSIPNGPSSVVVTSNATTAPNGTTTADKIEIANGNFDRIEQVNTATILTAGLPCTFSVYIKSISGTGKVGIRSGQSGASSVLSYTSEWQRLTWTFNALTTYEIPQFCNNTLVSGADSAPTFYAWGAQLNIGLTAKPYFPTTDRLNVPRLTYQNGGGGCPSLLLEKQSTNEWLYSEDATNWLALQCVVTANQAISPDGTQNADLLEYSNYNGSWDIVYQGSFTMTGTYSVWLKTTDGTTKTINLTWGPPDASRRVIFTVTGEWQRFSAQVSPSAQNIHLGNFESLDPTWTARSFYVWGAQLEASSYPTSYIPTTSSSATRVVDACFKTGISSLIGQTEGTLFADVDLTHLSVGNDYILQILQDSSNRILLYRSAANVVGCYLLKASGSIYDTITVSAFTGRTKLAFAYKSGSIAFYVNGSQIGTSSATFTAFSSLSDLNIDSNNGTENGYFSYNQVILFPTRLSNSDLASLTTI